jgi:V/A-type H+-transporting ATPase subunit E
VGLADILAAMEAAATTEEAALLETARARADAIVAAARAAAAATRAARRAEAEARLRAARAELETAARLEVVKRRAAARDALVQEAFAAAGAALAQARQSPDYPAVLERLLAEAVAVFPPAEPLVVACDPRDAPLLAALLQALGRPATLEPSLSSWGGVMVRDATGRVTADNTLERRLERARETLWPQVAALLQEPLDETKDRGRPAAPGAAGATREPRPVAASPVVEAP